ncbi:shikimate kinase [Pedobacter westerhofensis]|uniref:Shikimate kinase n=1 Tax=Pedobacter westerhofensis TaxID=425512 RepID=A0A521BW09_9SPHI|nr:shikimate kinase [Pedobacter westerhofensis]SMO51374.1 shikimate kinase [Pedobacter westerhofensis]
MKIFLIGFMGCGKTTLGKKFAVKQGFELLDLDHEIERVTGDTVANYFSANGEEAFRKLESETLKNYRYAENCIIATGGGTPCFFDNMDWMNANGTTVYIEMSAVSLAKRLEKGMAKRPLLRGLTPEGVVDFIENKLTERGPYYHQARITLNGHSLSPEIILQAVTNENQVYPED